MKSKARKSSDKNVKIVKIILLSALVILLGEVFITLERLQYGYMWYFLLMLIGILFVIIALFCLLPLIIVWKDQPEKRGRNVTPVLPVLLRLLQHGAVAIGSAMIYIASIGVPFAVEATPYMYVYSVVSIVATFFGNRYYIQYYRTHRLNNPYLKDLFVKLGISAIILAIMGMGIWTSVYTLRDIPYISNPKRITLYDVTLKYESSGFRRMAVYKMNGEDESGKKMIFKIGSKAVKELGAREFRQLEFTYLPNTNIIIDFK